MSERNAVGTWKQVGYVAPGATTAGNNGETTNFAYIPGTLSDGSLGTSGGFGVQWAAANIVALNDCGIQAKSIAAAAAHWTVTLNNTSNGNSITYTAAVVDKSKEECAQLTPSFTLISSAK